MSTAPAFVVSVDDRDVKRLLDGFVSRVNNPRPLLLLLQRYIKMQTMKMFRGPRPDTSAVRGVMWPKLAESTRWGKAAARKRGAAIEIQRPLVRTGAMRDSIRVISESPNGFTFGTDLTSSKGFPFPGAHNAGTGNLPQRRWLFLNRDEIQQMVRLTLEYVAKGRIAS